jgi:hypothetical protein
VRRQFKPFKNQGTTLPANEMLYLHLQMAKTCSGSEALYLDDLQMALRDRERIRKPFIPRPQTSHIQNLINRISQ